MNKNSFLGKQTKNALNSNKLKMKSLENFQKRKQKKNN